MTPIRSTTRIFTILSILLFGHCVSPVDIPVDNVGGQLVVSGMISTISEQNIVQIGLTADTERLPYPLSGATVMLVDDDGLLYYYQEDPYSPGNYILPDVAGVPGKTYYLIVDAGGRRYQSLSETLPSASGQIATHFEFVQESYVDIEGTISTAYFIKVNADIELPPNSTGLYYVWNLEENFKLSPTDFPDPFGYVPPPCFIAQNADPQRITLLRGDDLSTSSISNLLVGSRIVDWTFFERHYFTTYQSSVTKEAYEYWKKVDVLANLVGSIFDTPPAKLHGNIIDVTKSNEFALGYFQAVNQTMDRFYVLPSDVPVLIPATTCTFDGRDYNYYPQRCLDCPTIRNSSYRRPDWF